MDRLDNEELKEWSQNQPLSILRLDPIDRAILKISGEDFLRLQSKEQNNLFFKVAEIQLIIITLL